MRVYFVEDSVLCSGCGLDKCSTSFYKNNRSKYGTVRQPCKDCTKKREIMKRQIYKMSEKEVPEYKLCSSCGVEKHNSEFHKRGDTPTGLRDRCKICYNSDSRGYYQNNSERVIERTNNYQKAHREDVSRRKRERYKENPEYYREKDREYRRNNPEKQRQYLSAYRDRYPEKVSMYRKLYYYRNKKHLANVAKSWRARNKDKVAYYASCRRAKLKKATPLWVDHETIKSFYTEAQYFNLSVDHIIPLTHELVCGLHCEFNLQLMSLSENISKNNKFEVCDHDIPEFFDID